MGSRTDPRIGAEREVDASEALDEDLEEVLVDAREIAADEEVVELEEAIVEPIDADGEQEEEAEEEETAEAAAEIGAEYEREGAGIEEEGLLDVLLRTTGALPEEIEIGTPDEEAELPTERRKTEFVCSSCFLIKPRSQLGDAAHRVCRDCLDPPDTKHEA